MKLNIRRYELRERNMVWDLHIRALRAAGAYIGSGPWDNDLQDVEGAYIRSGGEFLVGTIDEQIVAMGALKKMTLARAEIKRMRVEPWFHRRGFGQEMLSRLELRARELGFSELQLDTMVVQIAAQGLYVKNGFQEFKRMPLGGHECIFFEKKLE